MIFDLSDDDVKELKAELIQARQLAVDDNHVALIWHASQASPTATIDARSHAARADRRQLTVLVCDMLGAADCPEVRAPTPSPDGSQPYDAPLLEIIRRLDGYIAQQLDGALLVYFGYPRIREDDAKRAVRAGLMMLDAVRQLNQQPQAPQQSLPLSIRLSVHTELTIVGAASEPPDQALGSTGEMVRTARQLCNAAPLNTAVISAETYRVAQDDFICRDLGAHLLVGSAKSIPLYRVIRERGVSAPPISMVGRQQDIECLQACWERAQQSVGQVALLSGEAGIGKSRLIRAFQDVVVQDSAILFECRCSPQHQHSAFYLLSDLLKQALGLNDDNTLSSRWHELESALSQYGLLSDASRMLLADILLLQPPTALGAPPELSPPRERQRLFDAIYTLLTGLAANHAVALVVEDCHWIDASTLEFLNLLMTQGAPTHLMIVLTCRPEFDIDWASRDSLTRLVLQRLSPIEIERLTLQITGGKALPDDVLQHLIEKTDGVPLFIEELTKMIIESPLVRERDDRYALMGSLPTQTVPSTLQGSLMARLDQLTPGKAVAQLGAVIGRTFAYELIRQVTPLSDADFELGVQQLIEAELLYQDGESPHARFTFKHALLQDIAYQSLLRSDRQRYHESTARVLASQFPDLVKTQPELIAYHFSEAGLSSQSIPYWQRAAQRAIKRSAHVETLNHLIQGLAMITELPDMAERSQAELTFQLMLGNTLVKLQGYGAPEVGQAYARSRELVQYVDNPHQLVRVLYGVWVYYLTRAEFQTALELAEEILALAALQDSENGRLRGHNAMGSTLCFLGEFKRAYHHLTQGMACEASRPSRMASPADAIVPQVANFAYASWALWCMGYPDQALAASQESRRLAEDRQNPFALAVALFYASVLHQLRREPDMAYEQANAVITLATELEFAVWVAGGTLVRGWALMRRGQMTEGFEQIQQGLAAWNAAGAELIRPSGLAKLAEAYEMQGDLESGLRTLDEALAVVEQTGIRYYEAELYRLKARLVWATGADDDSRLESAESLCRRAIAIAQQQEAKSLELRAATQLGQLWRQQGREELAQQLLRPIYDWFQEGFDTADLQEARVFLAGN